MDISMGMSQSSLSSFSTAMSRILRITLRASRECGHWSTGSFGCQARTAIIRHLYATKVKDTNVASIRDLEKIGHGASCAFLLALCALPMDCSSQIPVRIEDHRHRRSDGMTD